MALGIRPPVSRAKAVVGLAVFVFLPTILLATGLMNRIPALGEGSWIREAAFWAMALGCIAYVVLVEKASLSTIGLIRTTWKTFAVAVLSVVATRLLATVAIIVYLAVSHGAVPGLQTAASLGKLPLGLLLLMALRAGVSEEILFRGFAIERISFLTGSRLFAAALSLIAFTVAHLATWSPAYLIPVVVAGGVLTLQYLWRRDLASNIVSHIVTDAVGMFTVFALAHHMIATP